MTKQRLAELTQMVATRDRATGCWEWQGAKNDQGYGRVVFEGRHQNAHRVAFELAHGRKPNVCRHACDNRGCVNPGHLLDGTARDNAQDTARRTALVVEWKGQYGYLAAAEEWASPTGRYSNGKRIYDDDGARVQYDDLEPPANVRFLVETGNAAAVPMTIPKPRCKRCGMWH